MIVMGAGTGGSARDGMGGGKGGGADGGAGIGKGGGVGAVLTRLVEEVVGSLHVHGRVYLIAYCLFGINSG